MEDIVSYYYDKEANVLIDGDMGAVVFDIFKVITPNELMLFKLKQDYMIFKKGNQVIELHWPEFEDDDDEYYIAEQSYNSRVYYYDSKANAFINEQGFVDLDVFKLITPNELYLFKAKNDKHSSSPPAAIHKNGVTLWPDQT
jgi:hypothetical protein